MRNVIIIAISGVLLFCAGFAQAEPITIQISGNVTSTWGSAIPGSIHSGVTFNGTYTYDSSTLNYNTFSPQKGQYQDNPPFGFNISLAGYEFNTTNGIYIEIRHDLSGSPDLYYLSSYGQNAPLSPNYYMIIWDLEDNTKTALSSVALPLTAPVLNHWGINSFSIESPNHWQIKGTVTQATLIPEPVTIFLMSLGFVIIRKTKPKFTQ